MKLYLSSYKVGNKTEVLKNWQKRNGNRIIFIANSRDHKKETIEKQETIQGYIDELKEIGFDITRIDLREYFGKTQKLKEDLEGFNACYVIGGNTYVLRLAMKYSGFDKYIIEKKNDNFLYAGFSAGICVLSPSLYGLDIVDEPINPYNKDKVDYSGLNVLDFVPVPHYKSNHPESKLVDKIVELFNKEGIKYKTLKDGEVIIKTALNLK